MTDPNHIDRRSLLTSSMGAFAAAVLAGCGDDSSNGGGTPTGSSSATADGATTAGSASAGGSSGSPASSSSPASSGSASATPSASSASGADAGDGAVTDGSADGGSFSDAETDGGSDGAVAPQDGGAADGGGTGEAGSGGMPDGGGTLNCLSVVEMVNNHTHTLNIPRSDVERGYPDAEYELEDGGTGHSHTVFLSGYDFVYLQAGTTIELVSSTDASHEHGCSVTYTT